MAGDARVLVVVVNHRSAAYLPRLLQSLENEPEVASIVVRDNGSGVEERGALASVRRGYPAVTMHEGENTGFAAGVNAAVREAPLSDWDFVWVLNPDTEVQSGALARLVATARSGDYAVLSPLVARGPEGDRIWFAGGEVDLERGRSTHDGIGGPVAGIPSEDFETGFVSGAAPLIERSAWQRLQGFREHYFLYWEDADLSVRAQRAGLRLGVEPRAVVLHWQGGSSGGGVGPTYCFYVQRNRLWLQSSLPARLRVAFGRGRAVTWRLILFPMRRSTRSSTPVRAVLASLRGLGAGLLGPPPSVQPF